MMGKQGVKAAKAVIAQQQARIRTNQQRRDRRPAEQRSGRPA